MKEYSKNQGITLIALIVSIIVMLVLAGTTIAMLTGREGIYYRSDDAVHDTEKGKDMELIRMAYSVVKTSKLYVDEDKSAVTAQELEEALKTEENNENVKVVEKNGILEITMPSGYKYKVDGSTELLVENIE